MKLLLSLFWAFITVVVLLSIWRDGHTEKTVKLLWTLVILFMPIAGPLLWFWLGRKRIGS